MLEGHLTLYVLFLVSYECSSIKNNVSWYIMDYYMPLTYFLDFIIILFYSSPPLFQKLSQSYFRNLTGLVNEKWRGAVILIQDLLGDLSNSAQAGS